MKLLKALITYLLYFIVDKIYRHDKKRARKRAYAKTGKALHKARKSGKRVNGSLLYRRNYSDAMELAAEKRERRKAFIGAAL